MIVRPIVCRRFIGRAEELAYLHERRREAGASHGGMVFIAGEAGIGKSRLLREFCASLAKSRWRVGRGACLEFVQRPYAPVLDALAGLDPHAAGIAPAPSKEEQFERIAAALAAQAARSAIVLAIEDVHWADAATLELLAYLGAKLDTMRMLVVVTLRPEEVHAQHPAYAAAAKVLRVPRAGRIDLAPLYGSDLRSFIDEALSGSGIAPEVRRSIERTAEGNPFFTEELLKNAVERDDGTPGAPASLPSTVAAALIDRLRPLDPEERRVLMHAAVIGRGFEVPLLAQTLATESETLLPALRRARDLQLIEEVRAGEFRFRHALTREATYSSFLTSELQPMHRRIASTLEATASSAQRIDHLAYHWWAGGDAPKTLRYNELAGDAASAVHAHDDAIAFYERAAAASGGGAAEARLLEKIGGRRVEMGRYAEALTSFSAAAELFRASGEFDAEAACRVRAALQRYTLHDPAPTADLEAMLARVDRAHLVARARAHLGIAWIAATFYRPAQATEHLDAVDRRAIETALDVRLRYHNVRAWVWMILGDAGRFRPEHAAWLAAARETGPAAVAAAWYNSAFCFSLFGLHDEAAAACRTALEIGEEMRSKNAIINARGVAAFCAFLRGDLATARLALDALQADGVFAPHLAVATGTLVGARLGDETMIDYWFRCNAPGDALTASLYGAGFAEILHRRGRDDEARELLHLGIDLGERPRGSVLTMLAVARYGAEDDWPAAREVLRRAADAPSEVVERPALALFDAHVAQRHGATGEAVRQARAAADAFRRMGCALLEAAARELAGERAGALALYRACGASYDVRRLGAHGPHSAAAAGPNGAGTSGLTPRESAIATLVARGRSNLEIGRELSISHKTVEKHLSAMFQKLGLSSRAQLAAHVSRTSDAKVPTSAR